MLLASLLGEAQKSSGMYKARSRESSLAFMNLTIETYFFGCMFSNIYSFCSAAAVCSVWAPGGTLR